MPTRLKSCVQVEQTVTVEIDPEKFSEEFMTEFRESFYQFHTVEEHVEHLAQLYARGIAYNGGFIEGYGDAEDMGIKFYIESGDHIETHIWESEHVTR